MSNLSNLRQSTNDTARVTRNLLLFFLAVILFFGLLVADTNDLILFKRSDVTLPFMQIGVSVDMFYAIGPIIFIILHLVLLMSIRNFYSAASSLIKEIEKSDNPQENLAQTSILLPFDFVLSMLYKIRRPAVRERPPFWHLFRYLRYVMARYGQLFLLSVIVAVLIFILPLFLLILIQMNFLPYQSQAITFIHQCAIAIEFVMQIVFILRLGAIRKFRATIAGNRSWVERGFGLGVATTISFLLVVPVAFSWSIALVPNSWLDERNPLSPELQSRITSLMFEDWWHGDSCRHRDHIPTVSKWRRYLYLPDRDLNISEYGDQLDLSHRMLRYGWFKSSVLSGVKFSRSDLFCANFEHATIRNSSSFAEAKLHYTNFSHSYLFDVDFSKAELQETKFVHADIEESNFSRITSNRSNFRNVAIRNSELKYAEFNNGRFRDATFDNISGHGMRFFGTDLSRIEFHGSSIARSEFSASGLSRAKFYGTDIERSSFLGTNISGSEFHGANLEYAEFLGTLISGADFYGVNFSRTLLDGVYADYTYFYGTDLSGAKIIGTNLYRTNFYASNLDLDELKFVDLRETHWEQPEKWEDIKNKIDESLEKGNWNNYERRNLFADIEDNEREKFYSYRLKNLENTLCVWTDGDGPFQRFDVPPPACWNEVENYLVEKVCSRDDSIVASGIADMVSAPRTAWEAHVAVGFLKQDTENCNAITKNHHMRMCEDLKDWVEDEESDRWSRETLKPTITEICDPLLKQAAE